MGDVYKDLGHAYANVTPLTDTDAEKRIVDLTFEVQPGLVTSFERIEVIGNDKTRDKVIRRELRIYEGERFSGTGLRVSKQRVNALGFFETVEISTKRGSADDKVVATIEVKERPTGTFQIGAGFSSYENFILTGQISQQNFFGWGQTLSLQIQWSSVRQLGQIQFVEPYFLDTRWTFAFDLYMTEGIYTTFTRRSVGGSMTWGYELSGLSGWWAFAKRLEDMRLFATYTNEQRGRHRGDPLHHRARTLHLRHDELAAPLPAVGQARQPHLPDRRVLPLGVGRGGAALPRAKLPLRAAGEPLHALRPRRALLPPALLGDHRPRQAHPRPHPRLGRRPPGAHLRALLRRRHQLRARVPLSLHLAAPDGHGARSTPPRRPPRSPSAATSRPSSTSSSSSRSSRRSASAASSSPTSATPSPPASTRTRTSPSSLYKSVGFGFRWFSPIGPLRFEWGFPLDRRKNPVTGVVEDDAVDFQFTIGNFF